LRCKILLVARTCRKASRLSKCSSHQQRGCWVKSLLLAERIERQASLVAPGGSTVYVNGEGRDLSLDVI